MRRPSGVLHRHGGLWILCLAITLIVSPGPASAAAANTEQLARVRARIAALQQGLERSREERDAVRDELRSAERSIGALTRQLEDSGHRARENEKRLRALNTEYRQATDGLGRQRAALAREARGAFNLGQQEYLRLLLSQREPAQMTRVLTYYRYLHRSRSKKIAAVSAQLKDISRLQEQIERRNRELERLSTSQLKSKAALEDSRQRRTAVVARLDGRVADQSRQVARLRRDEARLLELLKGLSATFEELGPGPGTDRPFTQVRGQLRMPVTGATRAPFGAPRPGGLRWDGVFIDARAGEVVRAVYRGRVAFADWFGNLGLLLILDHGEGYMSLYGHNQALYADVGDWVETGRRIALAGNSGGLARPGLYFAIRQNGRPQDPMKWCRPA